ncbi:sterol desaturase/sphingolipid hydroxylase (fatty acid hydroxylase superfamily) [Saonia flava]|uniref:Sterol desaturase/sphingolipid hydroxylase (Fatty acid hydroxylase superfamily) n=1 Tax=Saonia flava TaxID=523696 RepID=A0A846QRE3_9FLAO|nr:sterol desaturase family protein [Saonia flava]NJB70711.1 sterol desaturase/sphingolipid hydroxylase (fatty acid hydroxylase superfamily) [Saonia flava]
MEAYANALLYAIPFFLVLLGAEILYGSLVKKQTHNVMDSVSGISSGLSNIIKDSLGLGIVLVTYPFFLKYLALVDMKITWVVWIVAFVALDFASYWNHRLSHHINYFWNTHMIHHSSEEFNLACALRQPISNLLGFYAIFLIPAALLGIPNNVIAILAPVHLFAQFWYHTKHIGKLGWLEYVIVTPSQHRVHHAINPEYIDKNLSAIFCVWDRMFGTFQEELEDAPPQFGVLKPVNTWNPIIINFQHLWRLIKDAWRTKNYYDKLRIWFMPTGWRPADVKIKYPVEIITDVYNFNKYKTPTSISFQWYVISQMLACLGLILFMFFNYGQIGADGLLLYGAFVFFGIYGYTTLMDGHPSGIWIEVFRGLAGIALILYTGDWFGVDSYISWGSLLVGTYFLSTILGGIYFGLKEKKLIEAI